MRVAVTGSSGLIGTVLCRRLVDNGHDVVRLVRRPVQDGVGMLQWDPLTGQIDRDGLEGVDAVVHLAGAGIGDKRWGAARKRLILESRTVGTGVLAEAVARLDRRPKVLVTASAIGFYGERGDDTVSEETGRGSDFLANVCQQWEAAAAPASQAGIRVAYARTGLVLTPHGGALPKLLSVFRARLGGRLGSGKQWWSWISLDDEVTALIWLIEHDLPGPVNLTAPKPVTNAEFTRILAKVLSKRAVLPVPKLGPRLLMGRELADSLLFTSAKVRPVALETTGFAFLDADLEACLLRLLA